jgi:GTP-binding protein HflX
VLDEQMAEVERVLEEIGAGQIPQVLVFNKLDKLEPSQRPRALRDLIERSGGLRVPRVFVSALDGSGLVELRQLLTEAVAGTLHPEEPAFEASDERFVDREPSPLPSTGTHDSQA